MPIGSTDTVNLNAPQFDVPLSEDELTDRFDSPAAHARIGPPPTPRANSGKGGGAGPGSPPDSRTATPRGRQTSLEKGLSLLYERIGAVVVMVDPVCGVVLIEDSDSMAESLAEYAKTNPKVEKALRRLIETSALGAVITAHAPLILTAAAHHTPLAKALARRMGSDDDQAGAQMVQVIIERLRMAADKARR